MAGATRPRVLRVITRLNVGGPAQHVLFLAADMAGFETTLAVGTPDPGEGDMDDLAARLGVPLVRLPRLRRGISTPLFLDDLATLWALWRLCRRLRPDIVHTHTAKAGLLGRLAARLAGVPVVCHTFHGHVLRGYFPWAASRTLAMLERGLSMLTTRIYAVSQSQKEELAALGASPASLIRVLPLGLDLAPLAPPLPRGKLRAELGLAEGVPLIGCVARLVPIKDHDTLLEAFGRLEGAAHLLLIGDGPERARLEAAAPPSMGVHFLGFRRDLRKVYGDLDLAVLSSRNEGMPVCLIEAAAAGVPIVATRVGGVGDLLEGHAAAILVPAGDAAGLAAAMGTALAELPGRSAAARAASESFRLRYGRARLTEDMEREYRELLGKNG